MKNNDFLNQALPGDQGGHALVAGELHNNFDSRVIWNDLLPALQANHNLGTIGLETRPISNVLIWAFRDGLIDREEFVSIIMWGELSSDPDNHKGNMIADAVELGISIVAFDTRHHFNTQEIIESAINELSKVGAESFLTEVQSDPSNLNAIIEKYASMISETYGHDIDTARWKLQQIGFELKSIDLLERNPHYMQTYQGIVDLIEQTEETTSNQDSVSMTLLNALADPDHNLLVINGNAHNIGKENLSIGVYGTVDETLALQGWQVQTVFGVSSADLSSTIDYFSDNNIEQGYVEGCTSQSDLSLFVLNTGEVIDVSSINGRPDREGIFSWLNTLNPIPEPLLQTLETIGVQMTCNDPSLPTALEYFGVDELNPALNPEVAEAIEALRLALQVAQDAAEPPSERAALFSQPQGSERHL